ncbi:MAG: hypothetical protein KDK24_00795 [Pseudooceanicola sp.]|nr:hypothetical protein [Pseudooceanicola sp.]
MSGGGDTQTGQDGTSEAGATAGGAATVQPGLRGPALRNAEAARERAADRVQERTVGTGGGFVRPAADASVSRQQALALQGSLQAQRVLELMAAPGEEKPSLRLPPARSQPPAAQKPATVSMDV